MILVDILPAENQYVTIKPLAYSEAFRVQMRNYPGSTWDPTHKHYLVPIELAKIILANMKSIQIADVRHESWPVDMFTILHSPDLPKFDSLRIYQHEGIDFLLERILMTDSAFLADEPGLGKSVQALKSVVHEGLLIVCPAVVRQHWVEQAARWCNLKLNVWTKTLQPFPGVISYDSLRRWESELPTARAIILDEIHYASHAKSARSKALRNYIARCREAAWTSVVGLSGTPMLTRPKDLWHPLELLWPGRFGTYWQFATRYCDAHKETIPHVGEVWNDIGASNLEELRKRLQFLMLRRTRTEVLSDLPERNRIVIPIEMVAGKQNRCFDLSAFNENDLTRALGVCEFGKIEAAEELTRSLLAQGSRPLLVTLRKETAKILAGKLDCPRVDGDTPAEDRRQMLLDGQGCAVATIYSITTGIDLVEFDSIIFVGLDWVPSTLLQAEARLHRIGQRRAVNCYYLIGIGTVDEVVQETVIDRLGTFSAAIGHSPEELELRNTLRCDSEQDLLNQILLGIVRGEELRL